MLVTQRTHKNLFFQNSLFVALLLAVIGLVAFLGTRYNIETDWTADSRNTLSDASIALLKEMDGPINITTFVRDAETGLRKQIAELIGRYQRHKSGISLTFINPDLEPGMVREQNVSVEGELLINYQGRREQIQDVNEQNLTNALQRLLRREVRQILFLEGHGERQAHGVANHDLKNFSEQLENKGFKIRAINLATSPVIPENIALLVIASPQVNLLPGETAIIQEYVEGGGNLLWLNDPGPLFGLQALAERLGIEFQSGTIVDPNTQLFGISDPRLALVAEYRYHPITPEFAKLTLFPQASGIEVVESEEWQTSTFLESTPRSWLETGSAQGRIGFDQGKDIAGPISLGISLQRDLSGEGGDSNKPAAELERHIEQRIVIIGDGDFLSNAFLGNAGNLDLGFNIFNWLSNDDDFIAIPAKTAPDNQLQLSTIDQAIIGFGFLLILPLGLIGGGVYVWWTRRKY